MKAWRASDEPLVSICCATFNHGDYIETALRSFLAQETDFAFEIVVRDDASSDKTADIVRDYVGRYPHIVRAILESENHYGKGVRPLRLWPALAHGKFIALCEGDDFWLSPHKLQLQLDLLARHPEAAVAVAWTDIYQQRGKELEYRGSCSGSEKALQYFDELKVQYFHTSTYVIRSDVYKQVIDRYYIGKSTSGDTAFGFILMARSPFVILPQVVSVYRWTGDGTWTSLDDDERLEWTLGETENLIRLLTGEYRSYQGARLSSMLSTAYHGYLERRNFEAALRLLPRMLLCAIRFRLPAYAKRRLLALGQK